MVTVPSAYETYLVAHIPSCPDGCPAPRDATFFFLMGTIGVILIHSQAYLWQHAHDQRAIAAPNECLHSSGGTTRRRIYDRLL